MGLIINQLIFVGLNISLAWYHAKLIRQNKKIYHGWWGLLVCAVIALFGLIHWAYIPVLIMIRAIVFSLALNCFRKLPLSYTSKTTTSIIDKIEQKVFPDFTSKMRAYVIAFVIAEIWLIYKV